MKRTIHKDDITSWKNYAICESENGSKDLNYFRTLIERNSDYFENLFYHPPIKEFTGNIYFAEIPTHRSFCVWAGHGYALRDDFDPDKDEIQVKVTNIVTDEVKYFKGTEWSSPNGCQPNKNGLSIPKNEEILKMRNSFLVENFGSRSFPYIYSSVVENEPFLYICELTVRTRWNITDIVSGAKELTCDVACGDRLLFFKNNAEYFAFTRSTTLEEFATMRIENMVARQYWGSRLALPNNEAQLKKFAPEIFQGFASSSQADWPFQWLMNQFKPSAIAARKQNKKAKLLGISTDTSLKQCKSTAEKYKVLMNMVENLPQPSYVLNPDSANAYQNFGFWQIISENPQWFVLRVYTQDERAIMKEIERLFFRMKTNKKGEVNFEKIYASVDSSKRDTPWTRANTINQNFRVVDDDAVSILEQKIPTYFYALRATQKIIGNMNESNYKSRIYDNKLSTLYNIIDNPMIEKYINAGYCNLIGPYAIQSTLSEIMDQTLKVNVDFKATSLHKYLRLSKYQLQLLSDSVPLEEREQYIRLFRDWNLTFGRSGKELETVPQSEFEDICRCYSINIAANPNNPNWIYNSRSFGYSLFRITNYLSSYPAEERYQLVLKTSRRQIHEYEKNGQNCFSYVDTINDIVSLNHQLPETDKIQNITHLLRTQKAPSDFVRIHDSLIQLVRAAEERKRAERNMKEEERQKLMDERMEKVTKYRKEKFSYEDDDFKIVIPQSVKDLATEGMNLHHCVSGYQSRFANGDTNILFLRRKSDIEKAFYTIEVRENNVIQIHGFGNKWLGNDPDAVPFVMRWLRDKGIYCDDNILLNTATGYTPSKNRIKKPVI